MRWQQFRMYPMIIDNTNNNPEVGGFMGTATETAGFPQVFNIESDPKERVDVGAAGSGWVMGPYLQTINAYLESLETYPNRPVGNATKF